MLFALQRKALYLMDNEEQGKYLFFLIENKSGVDNIFEQRVILAFIGACCRFLHRIKTSYDVRGEVGVEVWGRIRGKCSFNMASVH